MWSSSPFCSNSDVWSRGERERESEWIEQSIVSEGRGGGKKLQSIRRVVASHSLSLSSSKCFKHLSSKHISQPSCCHPKATEDPFYLAEEDEEGLFMYWFTAWEEKPTPANNRLYFLFCVGLAFLPTLKGSSSDQIIPPLTLNIIHQPTVFLKDRKMSLTLCCRCLTHSLCQFYIGNQNVSVIGSVKLSCENILIKHLFAKNPFRSACVA